jgi:hypothetical protein
MFFVSVLTVNRVLSIVDRLTSVKFSRHDENCTKA